MGLFSFFGKESKTTTNTTNSYTDNSLNAAEGSIAAAAGANVQILTADPDVAIGAVAGVQNTALGALAANQNVSEIALRTSRDVAVVGLDTTSRLAANAINSVVTLREAELREKKDNLDAASLALDSTRGLSEKIADLTSAALQRSQDPGSDTSKVALYVGGAVAVALVFALVSKKGKTP